MSHKYLIFFTGLILVICLSYFNVEAGLSQSKPKLPERPKVPCNELETAGCKKNCHPYEIDCKAQILETGDRSFWCRCVGTPPPGTIFGEARK